MMKRLLAFCALFLALQIVTVRAQMPIAWQGDTIFHSVVGRTVHSGVSYQNLSWKRYLHVVNVYFVNQADSIFFVNPPFQGPPYILPPQSWGSTGFVFKAPKADTTVYDTLVTAFAYTDDSTNVVQVKRLCVGTATTDSSSDSNRVCLYGHDCVMLQPVSFGDTAFGELCYEVDYVPMDTIHIMSIEITGRDAASFHLIDTTMPKSSAYFGRISEPYYFSPVRRTGVKRYEATAVTKVYSSDGILCHECDVPLTGYTVMQRQDSLPVNLFGSDTLALHFSADSTVFYHVLEFRNNSSVPVKLDTAYMNPGTCFAIDGGSPPFGTRLQPGDLYNVDVHYCGDSTAAGWDCSDTMFIVAENALQVLSFPMTHLLPAAGVRLPPTPLQLSLSPNPSTGSVDIQTGSDGIDTRIEIYDILGNLVASHTGTSWHWTAVDRIGSPIPNGSYIVRISEASSGRISSQRLLIAR
ncbi:MAG: T9SS type A sorting domain-containing protein [Bacteroidota bacterium]|nr:T9SS type A sorting domain-containing protein [Bacteroidota bacterium]MDP4233187.1 T9SS type A sorting domain-containing protein [Bacteroidota bacterium]MDP4242194.1 T9SS type A sorting domain-containing protein [Bacteroidota bacterium]MDP4287845.1 T9SS type A sorting domain-containing protein [Bacteroidota bacterium]